MEFYYYDDEPEAGLGAPWYVNQERPLFEGNDQMPRVLPADIDAVQAGRSDLAPVEDLAPSAQASASSGQRVLPGPVTGVRGLGQTVLPQGLGGWLGLGIGAAALWLWWRDRRAFR